jgi:hypothetical protein
MSIEKRERIRCDICREIISGKQYYSCKQENAAADEYITVDQSSMFIANFSLGCQPGVPRFTDVCLDCWEKMTLEQER